MNFDMSSLLVSFAVAGVGFVLFSYGRSMKRPPHISVGLTLMIFPYFVSSPWWTLGIAALLCAGLATAVRFGW